jgi:hypothetical protein
MTRPEDPIFTIADQIARRDDRFRRPAIVNTIIKFSGRLSFSAKA